MTHSNPETLATDAEKALYNLTVATRILSNMMAGRGASDSELVYAMDRQEKAYREWVVVRDRTYEKSPASEVPFGGSTLENWEGLVKATWSEDGARGVCLDASAVYST